VRGRGVLLGQPLRHRAALLLALVTPPPLVLSGHAATLTPYKSDPPRPSPRTNRTRRVPLAGTATRRPRASRRRPAQSTPPAGGSAPRSPRRRRSPPRRVWPTAETLRCRTRSCTPASKTSPLQRPSRRARRRPPSPPSRSSLRSSRPAPPRRTPPPQPRAAARPRTGCFRSRSRCATRATSSPPRRSTWSLPTHLHPWCGFVRGAQTPLAPFPPLRPGLWPHPPPPAARLRSLASPRTSASRRVSECPPPRPHASQKAEDDLSGKAAFILPYDPSNLDSPASLPIVLAAPRSFVPPTLHPAEPLSPAPPRGPQSPPRGAWRSLRSSRCSGASD
jgi:hypothetical protein